MISKTPRLTAAGQDLLRRALAGESVNFTRFKVGSGSVSGDDWQTLTDLVSPILIFAISDKDDSNPGFLSLSGHFSSADLEEPMRFRELGLFAEGEDGVETLYCYANDGDEAGTVTPDGDVYIEQSVTLVLAIGEAEHITATVAPGQLYPSKADFDAHVANRENPHQVTKAQVGLGNVPNVATNDQAPTFSVAGTLQELASGERLTTTLGKLAKLARDAIAHIGSRTNPHGVTASQVGAAATGHTHVVSDITSGVLPLARGGTGVNSADALISSVIGSRNALDTGAVVNFDTITADGIYFGGGQDSNVPFTMQLVLVCGVRNLGTVQVAFDIMNGGGAKARWRSGSTWTPWA